ncbi:hypothetical protein ACOSP7_006330 [Xanthoceras sorbifolium]
MSRARMMSYLFLITILLVFTSQTQTAFAILINPKYRVRISNEFRNNDYPLIMHCWSHDDDLGVHTIWKAGEWYWEFRNKFLGRTHFLCDMKHGSKEKTIDVYDSDNRSLQCNNHRICRWIVKDDGFFFYKESVRSFLKYNDW